MRVRNPAASETFSTDWHNTAAPVIQPTLDVGNQAMVVATPAQLGTEG